MKRVANYSSRKTIQLVILTKHILLAESLKSLLESKSEIEVIGFAANESEVISLVSQRKPDIVLLYLMEDELNLIEVIPEILKKSNNSKCLVLSDLNELLDQSKVLKLGALGIVGVSQKDELLIRAIRQVSDGEIWVSQQLISELLGNGNNGNNHSQINDSLRNSLTDREFEVVEAISLGLNNKVISKKLAISEATVRHHLSSIYSKLYIEDRLNLVIYAFQEGIVGQVADNPE